MWPLGGINARLHDLANDRVEPDQERFSVVLAKRISTYHLTQVKRTYQEHSP